VPVRRLALLLEKSAEKGLEWAVFEPNDANLWTGVEKSVSDFLYGFYRQGAFQGARPEQAYFVKCGLGETMTQQDLANGKLIVELGFAPVRPAEFVVLRLEWKMR
jgi:phage tail sheath protein FI